MSEVDIKTVEDLQKFKDWIVMSITKINRDAAPVIQIKMSHPAAKNDVTLEIYPNTTFGKNGNLLSVTEQLGFRAIDTAKPDLTVEEKARED